MVDCSALSDKQLARLISEATAERFARRFKGTRAKLKAQDKGEGKVWKTQRGYAARKNGVVKYFTYGAGDKRDAECWLARG